MSERRPWADRDGSGRGGRPWRRIRERVLQRDGYLCQACRTKGRVTPAGEVHHVVALSRGGTDDPDNLLSLCGPCHQQETDALMGRRRGPGFTADGWPVWGE